MVDNDEQQQLIEYVKAANEATLRRVIELGSIADPIERFRALEAEDSPHMRFAIARMKVIAVREIYEKPEAPSIRAIGEMLGLSHQRVHELLRTKRMSNDERTDPVRGS